VWVVVDGSTDGSTAELLEMAVEDEGLRIIVLPKNQGKGAAVLRGLDEAKKAGFSHVLTMDSDGQHPADRIQGRQVSNWWANLETLWAGIGDSLFGFRIYPVDDLRTVMRRQPWMRHFDFDPEAVVRLCWRGVQPINLDAPVRYFSVEEGGVSHFRYLRDNVLLTWMHTRLFIGFVIRLPMLLARRFINNR